MRQNPAPAPFVSKILMRRSTPLRAGRWTALNGIGVNPAPSPRRAAGESPEVSLSAVKAVLALAERSAEIGYVAGSDPTLLAVVSAPGASETVGYRIQSNGLLTTASLSQTPQAAVCFAAYLLAIKSAPFADAYATLLAGLSADAAQPELDRMLLTASDELLVSLDNELDLDDVTWYYGCKLDNGEFDEAGDPALLDLRPLFGDPSAYAAFRDGSADDFGILRQLPGASQAASAAASIDPDGFVGPQLDLAVRYMQPGRHVLHHGPTGTGKSFVWELAMRRIDAAFEPKTYPYFVHGSAGLEDIDFVGNYVLHADGSRSWVDGPLTRAMRDGKRIKVEEMNRLPGPMLNVLLGAMDYGRIALTRYDGQVINAEPGFGVDAMANIGREYTATEEIDPAILRRFTIKIEYDFLSPEDEAALLRSRQPSLEREDAETLARIAKQVRDAYEEGNAALDVDLYVSPAGLLNSAALVAEGASIAEAIELTWLADVAWTKAKRQSVREIIDIEVRDRRGRRRSARASRGTP